MQLILALPLPYCKNFVFAILSRNIKKIFTCGKV